jgi:hypothetical protein
MPSGNSGGPSLCAGHQPQPIGGTAGTQLVVVSGLAESLFDMTLDVIRGALDLASGRGRIVLGFAFGFHLTVTGDHAESPLDVDRGLSTRSLNLLISS